MKDLLAIYDYRKRKGRYDDLLITIDKVGV